LHNSQPWQWVVDGNRLHLFLDQRRVMLSDPSAREALIGCGAALHHLRVALAAAGWHADVERMPDPEDPSHLASIAFAPLDCVTDDDRRRADAILLRRTDRLPFNAPTDWESLEPVLQRAIDDETVRLDVMPDEVRPQLAEASQLTESLRLYDSTYHAELGWWTASFEVSEGIPHSSLVSATESDRVDVGRIFPVAPHTERRTQIPGDHSTILVLSTDVNSRADALATGEALSAILLECAMAGLATCILTHITEVKVTRELVAALVGEDCVPQVLVRVGMAPAIEELPPPTPRRPLDDVFRVQR
jgi:hypothetical protein